MQYVNQQQIHDLNVSSYVIDIIVGIILGKMADLLIQATDSMTATPVQYIQNWGLLYNTYLTLKGIQSSGWEMSDISENNLNSVEMFSPHFLANN